MRHMALMLGLFICVAGLIGVSAPAGAAPLLSVSYDVTGGAFSAGGVPSTISGGSAVATLPGGSTSTPVNCVSNCGYANIIFTGAFGTLPFNSAPMHGLQVTPNFVRADFTYMYAYGGVTYQSTGFSLTSTV